MIRDSFLRYKPYPLDDHMKLFIFTILPIGRLINCNQRILRVVKMKTTQEKKNLGSYAKKIEKEYTW